MRLWVQGAENIVLDPVTGLRVVEAARNHVEVDSYGNEIKEESRVDTLKASTKEERLRRTFEAIDEDESGKPDCLDDLGQDPKAPGSNGCVWVPDDDCNLLAVRRCHRAQRIS